VPTSESSLVGAASASARAGHTEQALGFWHRAVAINPWRADYHQFLGVVQAQKGAWSAAAESARAALRLDPANIQARLLLVQSYIKLGRRQDALKEYAVVMAYEPPDVEAIRRWYAAQE
jgi:tetratricopeptide (TPR) repeat protein